MGGDISHHPNVGAGSSTVAEAPRRQPQFLHSKSLDLHIPNFANRPSLVTSPTTGGSGSGNHQHFSDYCFYPDRFSEEDKRHGQMEHPIKSAVVDVDELSRLRKLQVGQSQNLSVPSTISRYNFRIRKYSDSDCLEEHPREKFQRQSSESSAYQHPRDQGLKGELPPPSRQRSNSLSSSLYYFDFSCIPEKDPKFTRDEEERRRRVRNASQGEDDYYDGSPPQQKTLENVVPKLILDNRNSDSNNNNNSNNVGSGVRSRKTSGSGHQFSFFDFSMIPDKMETYRCGNKPIEVKK